MVNSKERLYANEAHANAYLYMIGAGRVRVSPKQKYKKSYADS